MLRSIQSHPESGRLWKSIITQILNRIGFTTNTHDRTVYKDVYKTNVEIIYLIRQVYYFALVYSNESVAQDMYNKIAYALQITGKSDKPFAYIVIVTDINGIDIEQSREYIKNSLTNT